MKIAEQASFLLRNEIPHEKHIAQLNDIIQKDFAKLSVSGYLRDIILPQKHSFSELPFILEKERTVFRGRIDRVIIRDLTAYIYDYKTFPVTERELPELIDHYRFQMDIYKLAAEKLFALQTKGYLLFTHIHG